ncbi:MAG: hypothetical protein WC717_02065 [Candidatus Micrarchaeia archaeon]|jgi:hypothetical protein
MARAHAACFLAIVLFAGAAFALSPNSTEILAFASIAVPQGQAYAIYPFPLKGSQGLAVVSNGEVYGLFAPSFPILEDRPLTAPDEIAGALEAYYLSLGNSPNLTYDDIHAGIVSVSGNRDKGEAKCRVLTGTDRTACTSFDTCQKACYSVTSFCLPIALGVGRSFVDEIWEFENSSLALDFAYLNESMAYAATQDGITYMEAWRYIDSLAALNRAATRASGSDLYDGYSYCFEPDYALPVITNMQLLAQKRYLSAEPFFALDERAKKVRERTMAALELEAQLTKDADSARAAREKAAAEAAAALARANASAPPGQNESGQQGAPSSDAASAVLPLAAAAGLFILFLFAAGAYFFFIRGKRKP